MKSTNIKISELNCIIQILDLCNMLLCMWLICWIFTGWCTWHAWLIKQSLTKITIVLNKSEGIAMVWENMRNQIVRITMNIKVSRTGVEPVTDGYQMTESESSKQSKINHNANTSYYSPPLYQLSYHEWVYAIPSVGIEPTTLGLLDPRSNQLSYEGTQ